MNLCSEVPGSFYSIMVKLFKENYKQIEEFLSGMIKNSEKESEVVQTSLYSMRVTINYDKLNRYFINTKNIILKT